MLLNVVVVNRVAPTMMAVNLHIGFVVVYSESGIRSLVEPVTHEKDWYQ